MFVTRINIIASNKNITQEATLTQQKVSKQLKTTDGVRYPSIIIFSWEVY
jgi:hypothetical protein